MDPHENCGCSCVPNATVVVICWDNSTIEYEVPIDFGCTGADDCTAPNVS